MRPENSVGTPVDPVPFLVVTAAGFLACYSFGPTYLLEFGVELGAALAVSTVAFLLTATVAYHRLVWTARPELRTEIPVQSRFRRLLLAGVAIAGVFVLLTLPLY